MQIINLTSNECDSCGIIQFVAETDDGQYLCYDCFISPDCTTMTGQGWEA